jgi:hypothetical protein
LDSIEWSKIHDFETALHRPMSKGIRQKKRYPSLNSAVTPYALDSLEIEGKKYNKGGTWKTSIRIYLIFS